MLLRRQRFPFVLKHLQGLYDLRPRLGGVDNVVDEAQARGDVRVHELVFILADEPLPRLVRLVGLSYLLPVNDVHGPFGAHHGDLSSGPRVVDVTSKTFAAHDYIGAAIRLSGQNADLGHRGLGVGEYQLGPVTDDPAVFLVGARQETGDVDKGNNRNIEGVAEAHEPCRLNRRVDVQDAGEKAGLLRDDADGTPIHPGEADHYVPCIGLVDLHELGVVDDPGDNIQHLVGLVWVVRHEMGQGCVGAARIIP